MALTSCLTEPSNSGLVSLLSQSSVPPGDPKQPSRNRIDVCRLGSARIKSPRCPWDLDTHTCYMPEYTLSQVCCFREVSEESCFCPSLGKWSHSIAKKVSFDEDKGRVRLSHNSDVWRLHLRNRCNAHTLWSSAKPPWLWESANGLFTSSFVEFKAQNWHSTNIH